MFVTKKKFNQLLEKRLHQWLLQLESKFDSSRAKGANFIATFKPKVERLEEGYTQLAYKLDAAIEAGDGDSESLSTRISLLESQNETLTALCAKLASTMRDEGVEAIREAVLATHFHYAEGLEVGATYWLKLNKEQITRDIGKFTTSVFNLLVAADESKPVQGTWDGIAFTKPDGGIVRHGSVEQVIERVEIPDLS